MVSIGSFPLTVTVTTMGNRSYTVTGRGNDPRFLYIWEFPKIGVPYFGVLIIRIILFRVPY